MCVEFGKGKTARKDGKQERRKDFSLSVCLQVPQDCIGVAQDLSCGQLYSGITSEAAIRALRYSRPLKPVA